MAKEMVIWSKTSRNWTTWRAMCTGMNGKKIALKFDDYFDDLWNDKKFADLNVDGCKSRLLLTLKVARKCRLTQLLSFKNGVG